MEWNSSRLPVVFCMACGWRVYSGAFIPNEDDYENQLELIAFLFGWRY